MVNILCSIVRSDFPNDTYDDITYTMYDLTFRMKKEREKENQERRNNARMYDHVLVRILVPVEHGSVKAQRETTVGATLQKTRIHWCSSYYISFKPFEEVAKNNLEYIQSWP